MPLNLDDEMSAETQAMLAQLLRDVKATRFGSIVLVVEGGKLKHIQVVYSYDTPDQRNPQAVSPAKPVLSSRREATP